MSYRLSLWLAANAALWFSPPDWSWLRFAAGLALMFVLPGWMWLPALNWFGTRQAVERGVLVGGLSSLGAGLVLLLAVLAPGPFREGAVLLALNGLIGAGLLVWWLTPKAEPVELEWPARSTLIILLALIGLAAFTRLAGIGYGEFHEDELENMRLIVRAYKGEAYAPFLDSKGPIHWLLPAGLWYMQGWLTEGLARTPFAITGLLLVPMVYTLGRRMSESLRLARPEAVGLLAAGFVAINGFFVAYGKIVENQSLIILWGALAVWWLYRYYTEDRPGFLPWAGLALAVGLIAHPDILLYLPMVGFMLWARRPYPWRWLAGASLLFAGLTALFYIPYLTDPNAAQVRQYLAEDRIGTALLYNAVPVMLDQDLLYSTRFHAPVLILLLAGFLLRRFARWGWPGWLVYAGLVATIISTVARPSLWLVAGLSLAFVPYALLTLLVLLMPRASFETKTLMLWLMAPLGALLFLAQDAADHVQVAYPAWALLAGLALYELWTALSRPPWQRIGLAVKAGIAGGLAVIAGVIVFYQYLTFGGPVTAYWQAKITAENNPASLYSRVYGSLPRPRKLFSNPRLSGWKAVGYLWETGQLGGDFRSINESFAVPIWYTFQTPRSCYEDPAHYWVRRSWNGWPDEKADLPAQGYHLNHVVRVDGDPKLHLYQKQAPAAEPQVLDLPDYRRRFDLLATPARFARDEMQGQPASLNFGDVLLMRGYDPPPATATPGTVVPVTVYWEALAPTEVRYRGFVHLMGPDGTRYAQHDDDPACRLLTTDMRAGQQSSRQFRLPIDPATPPGEYAVVFGLYHPETLSRLPIWDNLTQQSPGDTIRLGTITIVKP